MRQELITLLFDEWNLVKLMNDDQHWYMTTYEQDDEIVDSIIEIVTRGLRHKKLEELGI